MRENLKDYMTEDEQRQVDVLLNRAQEMREEVVQDKGIWFQRK